MKLKIPLLLSIFISCLCFANEPINWQQEAGFYESNYPNSSNNEKALMLYKSMIDNGERGVSLEKKIYKIKIYHIYMDGIKVWPTESQRKHNRTLSEICNDLSKVSHDLENQF